MKYPIEFIKISPVLLKFMPRLGLMIAASVMLMGCQTESTNKPDSPLTNTYWKLTSLQGKAITTPQGNREMFLQFRADGLRGFAGCNKFTGGYTNTASKITFQPIATTKMFCQQSSQQEACYIGSLTGSVSYEINGESMYFTNASNAVIATFSAIYF